MEWYICHRYDSKGPCPEIESNNIHKTNCSWCPATDWNIGLVVQLVRIPACHAGGREFESRPDRN